MPTARVWTRPEDVRAAVGKEWTSGRLLATRVPLDVVPDGVRVTPPTAFPIRVRLRGPTASELGTRFDEARHWAARHESARGYRVESEARASRSLGTQTLPVAGVVDTYGAALDLLGRTREAATFDSLVERTPALFRWYAAAHPLRVLDIGADWVAVLAVAEWLRSHPSPHVYVRQVDLPGVHTKIVERHRQTIAALVDDGRPRARMSTMRAFEAAYGFRSRPARVRFRALDPATAPVPGLLDVTVGVDELAGMSPRVRRVVVVENEVSMLAFPQMAGALAIWGAGNQAPELLGPIGWLHAVDVHYWGDIDTHGFAILDRLRAVLPNVASMLMDRATLLEHRDRWGREAEQARRDLEHLTDDEAHLYADLCTDTWGSQVRLEQELIRFGAVAQAAARL
ncbi:MAG: Wadjet anti-phage system protein JetD domain-containing protein [Jiangellales bacterium]